MTTICYSKVDLLIVGSLASGMSRQEELELNVIPNYGGVKEDYEFIETNEKYFHLEIIDGVVAIVKDEPIIEPQEPTGIELLQQENQLLKAQNKALSERADFIEDVVAEMAIQVYQ